MSGGFYWNQDGLTQLRVFFNKHICGLYLLLCDVFDAIKKVRGWKDCWSSPCGVPVLTQLSALLSGKITNMCHYMPLYAGAGRTDWRRVWLCSCWTVGQDRLLGAPPGRQFAKSSKEKDQRDDSKVATIDEELREAKKDNYQSIDQHCGRGMYSIGAITQVLSWATNSPEWRHQGRGLLSPPPPQWAETAAAEPRRCSLQTPRRSAACWHWLRSDTW